MSQPIRPCAKGTSTRQWTTLLLLLAVMPAVAADHGPDDKPLVMGFFPLVSTVALFKRFSPLKNYLSDQLGHEVVLETAKDFPTFVERTAQRRYDIVVTAPHFAVRAIDSGRYRIYAAVTKDVQQLIVVRSDSPVRQPLDLAGKVIATPPAAALMTMMGKDYLQQLGLTGARQPRYQAFLSHNAANESVIGREADGAIASSNIISKALERGEPLRVIGHGLQLPNMPTLVASDLAPDIGPRITAILVGMRDSEAGRQVLASIGFPGYRSVAAADYAPARPYAYRGKPVTAGQASNP
jgi:phosphonate transport system substrate-binding protein